MPVTVPATAGAAEVQISAYIDTYAAFDSAMPADHRRPSFLFSHARTDGLTINQAVLGVALEGSELRAAAAGMAGTFAADNQGFEEPGLRNISEARVGLRLGGQTWLDAGVFPSHLGAEGALSIDSPTLTRSINAESSPYYLAGAKLSAPLGEQLQVGLLAANGWQTIRQTDPPSVGGGSWATYRPTGALTLNWSTWVGLQQPAGEARVFNDLYAVVSRDRLDLIAWVDVGTQAGAAWGGANLIARGWLRPGLALSGRLEHYRDPDGLIVQVNGAGALLSGASVGLDLAPARLQTPGRGEAMWRVEHRLLHANRDVFGDQPRDHLITTSLAFRL